MQEVTFRSYLEKLLSSVMGSFIIYSDGGRPVQFHGSRSCFVIAIYVVLLERCVLSVLYWSALVPGIQSAMAVQLCCSACFACAAPNALSENELQ